jgi:diacylglycerol kinase family enzyme
MILEDFGTTISDICLRSLLASGRTLLWTIIANPTAGGFMIKSRWKKNISLLGKCAEKAKKNPLRDGFPSKTAYREGGETGKIGIIQTRYSGHASEITDLLVNEISSVLRAVKPGSSETDRPFFLIITAGGDGTSLDVMTSLFRAPPECLADIAILRLPMGTGNDGSDAWELDKALDLLIEPAVLSRQRALRLRTASGKGPFLAFNILSVGLDAFVTHMTNKMKGSLPGDSYKLWVDIAALLYDRIYKVDFMNVRAFDDEGKEVIAFNEKLILLAVGESGRRSYGSHKWILPDERNVCAMRQMPLLRKLALKGLFAYGTHIDKPEAILWNARSVEFSALFPILAQMDGETVLLDKADFPATIELTDPIIPILKKA